MKQIVTTISASGPLFNTDPTIPYWLNVVTMLEAMAREGEADVKAQMEATAGGRAPLSFDGSRVSDYVEGRVQALAGKKWYQHAVISPNKNGLSAADATALYAGASYVEHETHAFRNTYRRLKASRAVLTAELVKGLT